MEIITCPCGKCFYTNDYGKGPMWWSRFGDNENGFVLVGYDQFVEFAGKPFYCHRCGSPLGLAADGTTTVGPTYAEVARKAAALDKLEGDSRWGRDNLGLFYEDELGTTRNAPDLLAMAEAIP